MGSIVVSRSFRIRGSRSGRRGIHAPPGLFSGQRLDPDAPVFDRAFVGLEGDGGREGNFQRGFEHLAVAGAAADAFLHGHLDGVPVARAVELEGFEGVVAVVAALELGLVEE